MKLKDPAYVMAQMGHTSPTMTLGLYAQVMNVAEADRDRLRQLVNGGYLAVDGSGAGSEGVGGDDSAAGAVAETAR